MSTSMGVLARMKRFAGASAAVAALACIGAASAPAATLPAGFSDELVTSLLMPTAIAFTPDGRMLVTTQPGKLYVGIGIASPVLALDTSVDTCSSIERGMLGVTVDPSFATNHYIYLYYTHASGNCYNRVSRFVLGDNNVVDRSTETVLIDQIPSPSGSHNAGDLHFGPDGYLYVSVGDGGCDYDLDTGCGEANAASRDQNVLVGKILRITRDGGIPPDNPFQGAGTGRCATGGIAVGLKCQETYAWGLRNPFRFAFDPSVSAPRFYINDVGQNTWEEIDLGQAGVDYGWNVREGNCTTGSTTDCGPQPAGMTNPIFAYGHSDGCTSITGGAFIPVGAWSPAYDDAYLFSDYVCGSLFQLVPQAGGGFTRSTFASGFGSSSVVSMTFGPAGSKALYYTTYAGGGQIRRIVYTGSANRNPVAALTASPSSGPAPLTNTLDASGSSDPDGNALTFTYNFGDGSPTTTTTATSVTHTYAVGSYTASVTANDGLGGTSTATASIQAGNTAPSITIDTPVVDSTFYVGQSLNLHATATDAQDGALPASSLSWTVIRHHDAHTHPFLGPTTGNDIGFTGPTPEDLEAAANSYLEIRATATDSQGLSTTVIENIYPIKVMLTFASSPSGLTLNVAGTPLTTPTTVTSWQGWQFQVNAPDQTDSIGRALKFSSWSDGGARQHTLTTPASDSTLTATLAPRDPAPGSGGLLSNGSFEGTSAGWAGSHAGLSLANDGIEGPQALKVSYNDTTAGFSVLTSPRPVKPTTAGLPYRAIAFIRSDVGPRRFCLNIREFNAAGAVVDAHSSCLTGTTSWQQFPAVSYTTQQSGGSLDVYVNEVSGAQPGDSFEIDGVQLTNQGGGATGLLSNESFEGTSAGWAGSHAGLSLANDGIEGAQALKVSYNDTTAGFSVLTSPRPVKPTISGLTYRAIAFIRSDVGPRRFCLNIREFNAAGAVVGTQSSCLTGTTSWQQFPAISYTTLVDGGSLDVYVNEVSGAQPGDSFEIDGARLSVSIPGGLLSNGSFEGTSAGWAGSHAGLSLANDGIEGAQALKVSYNDTTAGFSVLTSPRPVKPTISGLTYRAIAFFRSDVGPRRFCLNIREFNAAGAVVGTQSSCLTGTTSWQQFPAVSYTTLVDGGSLDVYVNEVSGAQPGDSFEIDGVQLISQGGGGL